MARASADWFHRGLISSAVSRRLAERYARHDAFLSVLGRWLSIFAILLLTSGVFALIGISSGSPAVVATLVLLGAIATWLGGIMLAISKTKSLPVTGATLVTLSFILFFAAYVLFIGKTALDASFIAVPLIVCAAMAGATAYGFSLRWPLFLAMLFLFHGIGSWDAYAGHGTYVLDMEDPPSMALIAAFVALCGVVHRQFENRELARYCGFGHIMIVFGLLYLNCALWFLSLGWDWSPGQSRAVWTFVLAAVALGEIVFGAFLKDSLFTGYGVVFLAITLYTQFFERFWDKLSLSLFFVIAGSIGLIIGFCFEMLYRRQVAAARVRFDGETAP